MTVCTKMTRVMERVKKPNSMRVHFREQDRTGPVEDRGTYRLVKLDEKDWADMGNPETVTVTIEPGDKLNEG